MQHLNFIIPNIGAFVLKFDLQGEDIHRRQLKSDLISSYNSSYLRESVSPAFDSLRLPSSTSPQVALIEPFLFNICGHLIPDFFRLSGNLTMAKSVKRWRIFPADCGATVD